MHDVLEAEELHAAGNLPRPLHEPGRVQFSGPVDCSSPGGSTVVEVQLVVEGSEVVRHWKIVETL